MKKLSLPIVAALALGFAGCGKEEKPAAEQAKDTASGVADSARKIAGEVKDAAKDIGTKAADAAKDAGQKITDATQSKAQELIDKAKGLFNENKYQDALNSLKGLASLQLTPEQQKAVDDLKARIQKALAGTSANNLIKP